MITNAELLKVLKSTPRARFYMCDLHVHSPASFDVRCGERYISLSPKEKELLGQVNESDASQPLRYEDQVLSAFPYHTTFNFY